VELNWPFPHPILPPCTTPTPQPTLSLTAALHCSGADWWPGARLVTDEGDEAAPLAAETSQLPASETPQPSGVPRGMLFGVDLTAKSSGSGSGGGGGERRRERDGPKPRPHPPHHHQPHHPVGLVRARVAAVATGVPRSVGAMGFAGGVGGSLDAALSGQRLIVVDAPNGTPTPTRPLARGDKSPHTAKPKPTHTHHNTYARTLTNQHGSHRQCRRNDATELAHADMTTLPKVDTICTALSVIPTVNGNTVRSFSAHGHQSAAKGSSTTVSRSDIRLILTFLFGSDGPEVALNWRHLQ
jgi:hypothetical protein